MSSKEEAVAHECDCCDEMTANTFSHAFISLHNVDIIVTCQVGNEDYHDGMDAKRNLDVVNGQRQHHCFDQFPIFYRVCRKLSECGRQHCQSTFATKWENKPNKLKVDTRGLSERPPQLLPPTLLILLQQFLLLSFSLPPLTPFHRTCLVAGNDCSASPCRSNYNERREE